jgi:Fe-S-cluster-containing hydrogenase component 2
MRPMLWIDPQHCQACRRCQARASCRIKAIVQLEPGDLPYIETQRCMACQTCVSACPFGAIDRHQAAVPPEKAA